jgi:hypothetical protein
MFALNPDWSTDQTQGKLYLHEASLPKRLKLGFGQEILFLGFEKGLTSNYLEHSLVQLVVSFVNWIGNCQ